MNNFNLILKSFSIFIVLTVINFMLVKIETHTIALFVFFVAAIIFTWAFISAVVKDKVQKRKTLQNTVFDS